MKNAPATTAEMLEVLAAALPPHSRTRLEFERRAAVEARRDAYLLGPAPATEIHQAARSGAGGVGHIVWFEESPGAFPTGHAVGPDYWTALAAALDKAGAP